jgi:hypothetical protein
MKTSKSTRLWFAFMGIVLFIGIYLSGFSNVHWLLYLPTAGFIFAAITGICPSQLAIFKIFGDKKEGVTK